MSTPALPIDRWIEIDLFYFQQKPFTPAACEVIQRLEPLWRQAGGDRGLILCCGWLSDLVTEWTGESAQRLPFLSPSALAWSHRTYAELRELIAILKAEAAHAGLSDFKVGVMIVGWANINWGAGYYYDLDSVWFRRHPEIYFPDNWHSPDFRQRLKADTYPYASSPRGIVAGTPFGDFLAGQWARVAEFIGFDAIVLRDGFLGPCIYEINGPFGSRGTSDPVLAAEWTRELTAFFVAVKRASPDRLVMGYSSARSAVAEFRTGCFDLEVLVAAGGLDVWIDQTWAGAWQDWWSQELRGWTFQLANVLAHHAMIAGGNVRREKPCRHYHLIETWDAWEPWDTLHQVPGKLRWGIWAFAHASGIAGDGRLSRTAGSYISWAHNWEQQLLSAQDVAFLQHNLDAAGNSAAQLEEVYGPTLVLNPQQLAATQAANPAMNTGDLIDDHAALLMKWGLSCLTSARLDDLPAGRDGLLLQTPAQLADGTWQALSHGGAIIVAIGGADAIDPRLLAAAGVRKGTAQFPWGKQGLEPMELVPDELPRVAATNLVPSCELISDAAHVIVRTRKTIVAACDAAERNFVWQPPCPYTAGSSVLRQHMFGSLAPVAALARAYQKAARRGRLSHVHPAPYHLPATFHYWRSGGQLFFLAGNLETGIAGDSRFPRELKVTFRKPHVRLTAAAHQLVEVDGSATLAPIMEDMEEVSFRFHLSPLGSAVYQVQPVPAGD